MFATYNYACCLSAISAGRKLAEAETMNREAIGDVEENPGRPASPMWHARMSWLGIHSRRRARNCARLKVACFAKHLILAKNLLGNQHKSATAPLNGLIDVLPTPRKIGRGRGTFAAKPREQLRAQTQSQRPSDEAA